MVKVAKQPGMEEAELLEDQGAEEGEKKTLKRNKKSEKSNLWDAVTSLLGVGEEGEGGGGEGEEEEGAVTVGVNETINIFSIASGHLYERFLR